MYTIKLQEKEYDLSKALPITLGDLKRLKKEYGVTLADMANNLEAVSALLLLVCRKVDPALTEDAIDSISVTTLGDVSKFLTDSVSVRDGAGDQRPT